MADCKPTGAMFDMDGTILDSTPMWESIPLRILEEAGRTPKPQLLHDLQPLGMMEYAPYLKREYSLEQPLEEIHRQIAAITGHYYRSEAALKPGAREFLQCLHDNGIPMAVTTATERALVEPALELCGVLSLFTCVLTCPETGKTKYHPDIFFQAAARMGSDPASTWLFEDALYSMATAKANGFPVCAVEDVGAAFQRDEISAAADCYLSAFDQWRQVLPFAAFLA